MADASRAAAFLRVALDRWRSADTFEGPQRTEGAIDLRFLNLQQWDAQDKQTREASGKHALVIDQIGEPYRQLLGQQRQARPGLQVNPVDNGADIETAEVFQGLIRHIETTGHAKPARDEAFKGAVGAGWGYYRLLTEYEVDQGQPPDQMGPVLFDQCIKYQAIENQFTVFDDPACPLYAPWKRTFCFIVEEIPKAVFKATYPHAIATSQDAFASTGLVMADWFPETSVRVADYFYVEKTEGPEVVLLQDGSVVPATAVPPGMAVLQRRRLPRRTVRLAKITGAEILDGNEEKTAGREWAGAYIPVVRMVGDSLIVDGKRILRGVARAARDLMRAYNYEVSELLYELACAPKSKVLMPAGAEEGFEEQWKRAPAVAMPYLLYNPTVTTVDGRIVQTPEPKVAHFTDSAKIQALVIAIQQLKSDLRSVTGWYDPTDPNRRNSDQSGRAILARKEAQNEGSVNYKDNYGQALLFEGMLLLDLIPKVYGRVGRVLRIVGEDGSQQEPVTVGGPRPTAPGGVQGIFAWGAGRYDVTVSIGASYTTRRQEAADFQLEVMKILPPEMAAATAPIAISNMDGPGNREISDRLDKMVKAQFPMLAEDADRAPQIPPEVQQQLQQADQVIQALTKELNAKNDLIEKDQLKIDSEERQQRADLDVKLQIAAMDNDVKLRIEELKLQGTLMQAELDAKQAQLAQMYGQAHEREMAEASRPEPPASTAP